MIKSQTEVKVGDIVYMAEFIDVGNGREIDVMKLVVHSVDSLGNVAVRDASRPDVAMDAELERTALYARRSNSRTQDSCCTRVGVMLYPALTRGV